MSNPRPYDPDTVSVILRFYEAIDAIITRGDIRGIKTYCDLYNIDRRNFYAQKKNIDSKRLRFQISWMVPVVRDFKVNATWLLTGKGKMFK
ncbi:MAG: hypothetical protein PHI28_03625 [Mangrovibacterium sp.]|nr:hypothetical protein [Mangrovibacterium sp.]